MRNFGIELECFVETIELLLDRLIYYDIDFIFDEIKKTVYLDKVKITKDSTLKFYENEKLKGVELCLPPSNNFELLNKVCNALTDINAQPLYNCALHIHIDCSDCDEEDVKNIYNWYRLNEQIIKNAVSKIQPNNTFRLNQDIKSINCDFEEIKNKVSRFFNLNIKSFYKMKTIEHRIFKGTIDFAEIKKCVELTQNIINKGVMYVRYST